LHHNHTHLIRLFRRWLIWSRGNVINIAMVANAQMTDAEKLASEFRRKSWYEAAVHHAVGESVAREDHDVDRDGGSEFDVVMISNFEAPHGAKSIGWSTFRTTPRRRKVTRRAISSVAARLAVL